MAKISELDQREKKVGPRMRGLPVCGVLLFGRKPRQTMLVANRQIGEEIKAIERKAAKSFNNMFKAMGDKQAS